MHQPPQKKEKVGNQEIMKIYTILDERFYLWNGYMMKISACVCVYPLTYSPFVSPYIVVVLSRDIVLFVHIPHSIHISGDPPIYISPYEWSYNVQYTV